MIQPKMLQLFACCMGFLTLPLTQMQAADPPDYSGIVDRHPPFATEDVIDEKAYWADLEPSDNNWNWSTITDEVDKAENANRRFMIRIMTGRRAPVGNLIISDKGVPLGGYDPAWLKTKLNNAWVGHNYGDGGGKGTFPFHHREGDIDVYVDCPKWWAYDDNPLHNPYMNEYQDLIEAIANEFDGEYKHGGRVVAVTISAGMTYWAEPCMRMGGDGTYNKSKYKDAGYSLERDLAAQRRAMELHAATFTRMKSSFAYNPYQSLDLSTMIWTAQDVPTTLALMDDQVTIFMNAGKRNDLLV